MLWICFIDAINDIESARIARTPDHGYAEIVVHRRIEGIRIL